MINLNDGFLLKKIIVVLNFVYFLKWVYVWNKGLGCIKECEFCLIFILIICFFIVWFSFFEYFYVFYGNILFINSILYRF